MVRYYSVLSLFISLLVSGLVAGQPMAGKPNRLPYLNVWKVGDRGYCNYDPEIFEVVRGEGVLVGNKTEGPLVFFRLTDTTGLNVGRKYQFNGTRMIQVTEAHKTLKNNRGRPVLIASYVSP